MIQRTKSKWHAQSVEELAPVRNALKINQKKRKVRSDIKFGTFVNLLMLRMMLDANDLNHAHPFFQDYLGVKNKVEVILQFHYLICMLLPVLKQINQDQKVELEAEAKMRGSV